MRKLFIRTYRLKWSPSSRFHQYFRDNRLDLRQFHQPRDLGLWELCLQYLLSEEAKEEQNYEVTKKREMRGGVGFDKYFQRTRRVGCPAGSLRSSKSDPPRRERLEKRSKGQSQGRNFRFGLTNTLNAQAIWPDNCKINFEEETREGCQRGATDVLRLVDELRRLPSVIANENECR